MTFSKPLALAIFAAAMATLTPQDSSAQAQQATRCPAGYDLVGSLCFNGSTGDVVLPEAR